MNQTPSPTDLDRLLVATKFAPPRIGSRYIVRTQLLEALRRDQQSRLTLVTGSAGFGKTILVAQWRQELMKSGLQVSWLTLSNDERQLANFRTHLFAAIGRLGVPIEDELLFATDSGAAIDAAIASLVNRLASREEMYLILDDYHHVEDPLAHRLVQKLLEHGPANLHLVLASRAMPPLSIAKLRVMGQVAEIECGDLPFNLAETRAFLEQNCTGLRLTADEVVQIHEFTNGWPASVQLVSIMLKTRPESRETLRSLAWQYSDIQNYLSEEVVGHLPTELADFMESLSICRRFNVSLAEAITENRDAAALIGRIEEENLLIMRADSGDRSPWYRFHPLFAEFLSKRLARRGAAAVDQLHGRAAAWFAGKRLIVEAVRHASLGGDLDTAVDVIERSVPGTWKLSYLGPLLHLINNLPEGMIAEHPRLLYLGSLTLALVGSPARAEEFAAQMRDDGAGAAFRIALARAMIDFQRDEPGRALTLLAPFRIEPSLSAFERYVFRTLLIYGSAAEGDMAAARAHVEANPIWPEDADEDIALLSTGSSNTYKLIEGRVAEAKEPAFAIHARSVALHGRHSSVATMGAIVLASISYELNEIDEARELIANWQQMLRRTSPQMLVWATLCESRLDLLQNSTEAALALLQEQAGHFRALGLKRATAIVLAEQARVHLAAGHIEKAAGIASTIDQIEADLGPVTGLAAETGIVAGETRARVHLASGRPAEALAEIEAALGPCGELERARMEVTLKLLAAHAFAALGQDKEAGASATEAVRWGTALGLIRTFLDEGRPTLEMMRRHVAPDLLTPRERDHLALLLSHCNESQAAEPTRSDGAPAESPLTPREVGILGLVAAGMSNKRVALTLGITLETVKWNLKNVFMKLGVSSRYDAMIWARRQGLID